MIHPGMPQSYSSFEKWIMPRTGIFVIDSIENDPSGNGKPKKQQHKRDSQHN
ncbi:hypothetical protein DPMN_098798 [Dreissena polymorpha]|uniref:Uncharacterized protein n=1 Tax=Dreissena polymorpha TaxID=45954 RepID=A0A9D4R7M4_DREPO|nr:hypothetical protein DPMN_098798 [Dreissena polymorpha]